MLDSIDVEHIKLAKQVNYWTHPSMEGGVGGMSGYHIAMGQPVYLDDKYFGLEFAMGENYVDEEEGVFIVRQYSGKTYSKLEKEKRCTNGAFYTWPSVFGSARTSDSAILRADFLEYIRTLQPPTVMRTQYNSWYDWMMDIDEENIQSSFKEMERGLSAAGMDPLDAWVVDDGWNAYGPFASENTDHFW